MKIDISNELKSFWSSYKHKYNSEVNVYSLEQNLPIVGRLYWIIPDDVIWLYATNNEEDYEGSQTQIGIKKDGTIVWGYFSHCSCYGYEDYKGEIEELTEENLIHTQKTYELENVDNNILNIIKSRIEEMIQRGLKD